MSRTLQNLLSPIVILFAPAFLVSCVTTGSSGGAGATVAKPVPGKVFKIACIGDSITFGDGLPSPATMSWPAQLQQMLGGGFEVRNYGRSGVGVQRGEGRIPVWNTPEFSSASRSGADLVVLFLGSNDSKASQWTTRSQFGSEYRELVDHFQGIAGSPEVVVCLPIPIYKDVQGFSARTLENGVLPVIRRVAREKGLRVIDLHTGWIQDRTVTHDEVHPNQRGSKKIARQVKAALGL